MSQNEEQVVSPENGENRETSVPFHANEDDCDVLVITKDKDLLFQSAVLNFISKSFQESWILGDNKQDGKKVVEMKDTDGDVVVEALSFYYPRFYKHLEGNHFCYLKGYTQWAVIAELDHHISALIYRTNLPHKSDNPSCVTHTLSGRWTESNLEPYGYSLPD